MKKEKISAFVICGLLRSKRALYLVNTSEEIVFLHLRQSMVVIGFSIFHTYIPGAQETKNYVHVDKTGNAGTGRKIRPVIDFIAFFINFISANKKPNYLVDSKIILIFTPES